MVALCRGIHSYVLRPGVHNMWPTGHMRPAESRDVARWIPPTMCLFSYATAFVILDRINMAMNANILLFYQ